MTSNGKEVPSVSMQNGGLSGWGYLDKVTNVALDIFLAKEKAKAAANAAGADRLLYTQQVEVPVASAVVIDENKRTNQQGADANSKDVTVFGVAMRKDLLIFSGVMLGLAAFFYKAKH